MFRSNYFSGASQPSSLDSIMPLPNSPATGEPDADNVGASRRADCLPTITISLQPRKASDRRTIDVRSGEILIIGRASRSELKNLQAAPTNALFDCPVISRVHAELRASTDHKHICITDCSSLHGTTVNGIRLLSGIPFNLEEGDVIKLGEQVTRGADIIDGVSLTFNRIDNHPKASSFSTSVPTRGFSVPSPSEADDSDYDSDSESARSYHDNDSSADTTPEQHKHNKPVMGTEQAPIDLDSFPLARPPVIFLEDDGDDEEELLMVPESAPQHISEMSPAQVCNNNAQPSYIHKPGSSQIDPQNVDLNDAEDDIESGDDAENLSDSAASDLDNADEANPALYRDHDKFTAHRPVSPKLGGQFHNAHQPSKVEYYQPPAYDPIRNLQPLAEDHSRRANEFSAPYKAPNSAYTYDLFGYGTAPALTTDFQTSSRWDIAPTRRDPFSDDAVSTNHFGPPPLFPSYGTDPNFGRPGMPPPPPPPPPPPAPAPAQPLGMDLSWCSLASGQEISPSANTPAFKSKISIPDIVDEGPKEMLEKARAMVEDEAPSTAGLKRKATDASEEAADSVTKKLKPASANLALIPRSRHRHSSRARGIIRSFARHTASATLGGVVGSLGMVAFLNSDLSQRLIEWLA